MRMILLVACGLIPGALAVCELAAPAASLDSHGTETG